MVQIHADLKTIMCNEVLACLLSNLCSVQWHALVDSLWSEEVGGNHMSICSTLVRAWHRLLAYISPHTDGSHIYDKESWATDCMIQQITRLTQTMPTNSIDMHCKTGMFLSHEVKNWDSLSCHVWSNHHKDCAHQLRMYWKGSGVLSGALLINGHSCAMSCRLSNFVVVLWFNLSLVYMA